MTTDPTMPANAPDGSDSSEREALAKVLYDISPRGIYPAWETEYVAHHIRDEFRRYADALIRAGFTRRAQHDGEKLTMSEAVSLVQAQQRIRDLTQDRDEWLRQFRVAAAERDALAAKLDATKDALDLRAMAHGMRDKECRAAIARAEAAEAKLATAIGCLDTEAETLRRVDAAEARAAALAEAVTRACGKATQGHLGNEGWYRDVLVDVSDILRAALAGNGTGGDGWVACGERMPERSVNVIAWRDGDDEPGVSRFYDDHLGRVFWFGKHEHDGPPTHWRPLPAAPPTAGETNHAG